MEAYVMFGQLSHTKSGNTSCNLCAADTGHHRYLP